MKRYLVACGNRKRKAMTLYKMNIRLSQEVYVLVNYFEIALRNSIDREMISVYGEEWLKESVMAGGFFDNDKCKDSRKIIQKRYSTLLNNGEYSHSKLLSTLEFGIWRYMYSPVQYKQTGQILLKVFVNKPKSSPEMQYNNKFFFEELQYINTLRNRIAHQEPICFSHVTKEIDLTYIRKQYQRIMMLFGYMGIDGARLLKGFDDFATVCKGIERLENI
ncbi:MAG: Abi family protein [Paludibacteraceae bacterium]|nr:Abi family protein [Paludibacteraceae bacterium]